jgi:outer membrane biosynthesis protein TonB
MLAIPALLAIAGCGSGGDTTTVVKEVQPETVERTTTVEVPASEPKRQAVREVAPEPEPESEPEEAQEPPNVVGLPLPAADRLLKEAGYKAAANNTDTAFGIIVRSNYTVCTQGAPRGNLVPVLAQKYGC